MKKSFLLKAGVFLICMLLMSAAGCSGSSTANTSGAETVSSKLSPDALAKQIGAARTEVLAGLGIAEAEVTVHQGVDILPEAYASEGREYSVFLSYTTSGTLFRFWYQLADGTEPDLAVLAETLEAYKTRYGEPSTYPGVYSRYYGENDPAQVFKRADEIYETWDLSQISPFREARAGEDNISFVLIVKLQKFEKRNELTITYTLQGDRNTSRG